MTLNIENDIANDIEDHAEVDTEDVDVAQGEAPAETSGEATPVQAGRNIGRIVAYVVLPVAVLAMACGVGFLKWQANSIGTSQATAAQSVSAATEIATAMLSYRADQVEQDLTAASDRMTGEFRNEYTTLINDVVIPGAKEKRVSAEATVPAAALVSSSADRAEVLVYIDQTTTVGDDPPSATTSSARVSLEKVGDRWLLAGFEPV
uniref:Mce associated membrane protein n=2 Tax=unclassified Mycobacterium TaxID=2642494 RepID=A0A5Q5BHF6_MYCSS